MNAFHATPTEAAALALYRRAVQLQQLAGELHAAARELLTTSAAAAAEVPSCSPATPPPGAGGAPAIATPRAPSTSAGDLRRQAVATRCETAPPRVGNNGQGPRRASALRAAAGKKMKLPRDLRAANEMLEELAAARRAY